ncbi:hypothetical protein BC833DRAFT_585820 [Globomyces pollinis-pini]|nr:hypothetical protein BC833DRAFT_585820 [Globomyces pollinis-pini]
MNYNNHVIPMFVSPVVLLSDETVLLLFKSIMSTKVFNDPIHGHIELEPVEVQVIDTMQFQRLRELKQLGVSYYVYLGATHHRFEHSIGVCHLAGVWIKHLRKTQPELNITDTEVKCVRLAGLTHDLGHGPFSHLFENGFIRHALPKSTWTHEQASEDMLSYMVEQNPAVDINDAELTFIKDLIHGKPRSKYPEASKGFLFEIVANTRNSIDVDKFDYILRDCHNVGMKETINPSRLITLSRVIDNQICFNQKEAYNLYEVFHCRFSLFKQVYTHRVSTAIEYMIKDIFLLADPHLKISQNIHDMSQYVFLDDSILLAIERSQKIQLKPARDLLKRLRKRDLYKFIDQVIIPFELLDSGFDKSQITSHMIWKLTNCKELKESDIIVQWLTLNYAMKDRNPVDSVRFYSKYDLNKAVSIRKEQVSGLIPEHYKEVTVRVYSRQTNTRFASMIQIAFRTVLQNINAKIESENLQLQPDSYDQYSVEENDLSLSQESSGGVQLNTPIADHGKNPFLDSPEIRRPTSVSRNGTPSKRLLEVTYFFI